MKRLWKSLSGWVVLTLVMAGSQPSHADSIGSELCVPPPYAFCFCPYTCCYPIDAQSEALGDNFYNPRMCHQEYVNYWWSIYEMEVDDWDDGWGYYDHCNPHKPLGRLFHAMYALTYSAPAGAPASSPLVWGYQYAFTEGEEPIPDCATSSVATAKNVVGDKWIQLHYPFFYAGYTTVPFRAGTLVHEARHLDGGCHHNGGSDCIAGASCDQAWDNGCEPAYPLAGATQFEIVWLWDFFKQAINTTTAMRHHAVDAANDELYAQFVEDPCFRIGPDGKAYQLPIPACEHSGNQTDYGAPSLVRPEEFQLNECVIESYPAVKSAPCSYPYYSWWKWQLEPVRDQYQVPLSDGRVRIVHSSGLCLRLSQTPVYQNPFPSGMSCEGVPWLTTLVMGSCSGREAEFFVTPWAAEDTSPGLAEPDAWRRWRIRPYLRCKTVDGDDNVMYNGDSCLDANATGDHVLRVFWCHDSPRQQFRASDWY